MFLFFVNSKLSSFYQIFILKNQKKIFCARNLKISGHIFSKFKM